MEKYLIIFCILLTKKEEKETMYNIKQKQNKPSKYHP